MTSVQLVFVYVLGSRHSSCLYVHWGHDTARVCTCTGVTTQLVFVRVLGVTTQLVFVRALGVTTQLVFVRALGSRHSLCLYVYWESRHSSCLYVHWGHDTACVCTCTGSHDYCPARVCLQCLAGMGRVSGPSLNSA